MAQNLIWKDLKASQLEQVRHPHPKRGLTSRDMLAKFCGLSDTDDPKNAITLDLYANTLRFGQTLGMADDKLSGLLSIMKEVHLKSIGSSLQVDRSFQLFKDLLMAHSLQRPPYSTGLFTLQEMKATMEWVLHTYYRHYKLYMYAFTDRVLLSVTQVHPLDDVEAAPSLQPLNDALTEEQHAQVVSEKQREAEKAARQQAEADAAAAEVERQARLKEEYAMAVPDEIRDEVAAAVEREMTLLKNNMEDKFQLQQKALQSRIEELETKVGGK